MVVVLPLPATAFTRAFRPCFRALTTSSCSGLGGGRLAYPATVARNRRPEWVKNIAFGPQDRDDAWNIKALDRNRNIGIVLEVLAARDMEIINFPSRRVNHFTVFVVGQSEI